MVVANVNGRCRRADVNGREQWEDHNMCVVNCVVVVSGVVCGKRVFFFLIPADHFSSLPGRNVQTLVPQCELSHPWCQHLNTPMEHH